MQNPFRWTRKDRAGKSKAEEAIEDATARVERIEAEIDRDRLTIRVFQDIRDRNHLAHLFDDAYRMNRRGEEN